MNNSNPKPQKGNRIARYISKEIRELKRTKQFRSNRKAFLISDSKSKDLKFLKGEKYVRFYYKGGAEITDPDIQSYAAHQVTNRLNKYPVIIFWFGTCSLTEKQNGLFVIKNNLEEVIQDVISSYVTTKEYLLKLNPRAKVVFLDCPYTSLSMYNTARGKKFKKNLFDNQQRELIKAIDLHNKELKLINKYMKTPNLNKDFSSRTNPKRASKPRTVVDYSQLRDGCHIGRKLAELWLIRIHRLIYRI